MATGHTLAVVTNSCVKPPKNPRTKLAATLNERDHSLRSSWKGQLGVSDSYAFDNRRRDDVDIIPLEPPGQQLSHGTLPPDKTDLMIASLTEDVSNLTDEEFYRRLMELKNEHKKTLGMVERLYSARSENETHHCYPGECIHLADHHKTRHIDEEIEEVNKSLEELQRSYRLGSHLKDNVRDMSAKPPLPTSSSKPQSKIAHSESPVRRSSPGTLLRSNSYSGEDWKDITLNTSTSLDLSASNDDLTLNDNASTSSAPTRSRPSSATAVIDDMWDGFSVDDYAPRSRSRTRVSSRASSRASSKEWSPKITIPKPFKMTLRDSGRVKKKSKAAEQLEKELLEKQKMEEAECQKKFKASPAPAHTFLPLYDEIVDKQEEKRIINREFSKELVKSYEKPFKFMRREEEKKKRRMAMSFPVSENKSKAKPKFRAKPIPKSVKDPTVNDKIQEEEEYRKIRIKMRAEEMLRQSSLPPNMEVRGREYTDGRSRHRMLQDRENRAFITKEHQFAPKINPTVPDYDDNFRKFQKKMTKKKLEKEATAVQPFNLRTSRIRSKSKERILQEMEEDSRTLAQRWPYLRSRSMSPTPRGSINIPEDSIPAKMTQAAQLRESAVRKSLEERTEQERAELERERMNRLRERKMRKFIVQKALANDQSETLQSTQSRKIKQFRQSERSRKEEYEQQLHEMMSRIETRPLLFERESQTNAKRQAEKKYQQALRDAGIEETFILRKSGGKASARDDPCDSDDGDDDKYTYSFSGSTSQSAQHKYTDDDPSDISSIQTEED
ncbi:protein FAM161B-like [Saccoglossus kowalevskii]|uniref:Protein FAM161B-like n=1 Tax=Saccoglossus kowalevskii TaxID=10224 RepID=A0ABM0GR46_SACKO|nr:PREDICTED: protein FAM161B-like [Saccoglossus kowalevskii]